MSGPEDLTVALARVLRQRYPSGQIAQEAENIADIIRSIPGVLVAHEAVVSAKLDGVIAALRAEPAPRCPTCGHPVSRHNHGSFEGLAECLERDGHGGMCWCKHYMTPDAVLETADSGKEPLW